MIAFHRDVQVILKGNGWINRWPFHGWLPVDDQQREDDDETAEDEFLHGKQDPERESGMIWAPSSSKIPIHVA